MIRLLKTLLLWLLIAALPIQAMAAVAQSACGSEEHGASMAMAMPAHRHDDMAMSRYAIKHVDATMMSQTSTDHAHGARHKHTTCSACASCYAGAVAPPSALLLSPSGTESFAVALSPSPMVTGFIPAGLERPPKRITA